MGDVIIVCSEKRDIGKSVVAIRTAIELSKSGKKVLMVDISCGKIKISEYLKVNENIIYDVKDVLDETCSIEHSVINITDSFSILPYPRIANKLGDIKREAFTRLIVELKKSYDIIIVDADKLSSCYFLDLNKVYGVIIINNNDFSALKEINGDCDIANKYGIEKILTVINKYNKKNANKGLMLSIKDMKKMTDADICYTLEENIKYDRIGYEFLFSNEKNSFTDGASKIASILNIK